MPDEGLHMPGAPARDRAPSPPPHLCLARWWQGCRTTELLGDLAGGTPLTVLAPVDAAFDDLPWSFERLLADDDLLELRFDLFEHHVLRGTHDATGAPVTVISLHGERVHLARGVATAGRCTSGGRSRARVLATLAMPGVLVHVIDACLLPRSLRVFADAAAHDPSAPPSDVRPRVEAPRAASAPLAHAAELEREQPGQ